MVDEGVEIGLVRIKIKRGVCRQKGVEDLLGQRGLSFISFDDEESVDVISHQTHRSSAFSQGCALRGAHGWWNRRSW